MMVLVLSFFSFIPYTFTGNLRGCEYLVEVQELVANNQNEVFPVGDTEINRKADFQKRQHVVNLFGLSAYEFPMGK
jgi:hypothetical protein